MKLWGIVACAMILAGAAQAAPVSITNGNFESPYNLTQNGAGAGDWDYGAAGWSYSGAAGTWAANKATAYSSTPGNLGARVGFANAGATLSQSLGITIADDTDYILSAAIGDRLNKGFGGTFGFFAGDPSNIIASVALISGGDGLWTLQNITAAATAISAFVGMQLGVFFTGTVGQINFDNVSIEAVLVEDLSNVIVNPLPGAVWLFGTAIAAGGFASRRRKKV